MKNKQLPTLNWYAGTIALLAFQTALIQAAYPISLKIKKQSLH